MNELYGVDPEAPMDIRDLKALLDRFGLANGRFIGRYPDDWVAMLESHFTRFQDVDRARLNRLLVLHKDAFLSTPATYMRSKTWPENASKTRGQAVRFHKIFAREGNDADLPTLSSYLWDSDEDVGASRGSHIQMTASAYANACRPLFEWSSEVHLADRFFQLRRDDGQIDRNRSAVLRDLLRCANELGHCQTFILHFKSVKHMSEKEYEAGLIRDLQQLADEAGIRTSGPDGMMINYDIHDSLGHGRYIFSIKGGLQFDHGFDLDRQKLNHVHWLGSGELLPIHQLFGLALRS